MAELKPFEVVMKIFPLAGQNGKGEVVMQAERVTELVRCKDCKWWKTNYKWNGDELKICAIEAYEPIRKSDDFCSRGERREDE